MSNKSTKKVDTTSTKAVNNAMLSNSKTVQLEQQIDKTTTVVKELKQELANEKKALAIELKNHAIIEYSEKELIKIALRDKFTLALRQAQKASFVNEMIKDYDLNQDYKLKTSFKMLDSKFKEGVSLKEFGITFNVSKTGLKASILGNKLLFNYDYDKECFIFSPVDKIDPVKLTEGSKKLQSGIKQAIQDYIDYLNEQGATIKITRLTNHLHELGIYAQSRLEYFQEDNKIIVESTIIKYDKFIENLNSVNLV